MTSEHDWDAYEHPSWVKDSVVIGRKETMEFILRSDTLMLAWKNRLNEADALYYVSGFDGGIDGSISCDAITVFDISKVPNHTEGRLQLRPISEKNIQIDDYSNKLHKAFVASEYAVFPETDDDNGDDSSDSGDDGNDGDGYIKVECPRCHGSGECRGHYCDNGTCTRCGGSGYRYDKGVGGTTIKTSCIWCIRGKCETCRGSNKCPACNGKGYIYGQK